MDRTNLAYTVQLVLKEFRVPESFQLQMRISFTFLRAKDLRTSLLIMRTCSFFTLLYVGGKYARLVYTWYKNIFFMIAVLIVFLAVNEKK